MLATDRLYSKCVTDYAQLEYTKLTLTNLIFFYMTNKIKLLLKMLINWHSNFFS